MAEASKAAPAANKVPEHGDHDRVQMLSLNADGTPDQHNPEIIGDKDTAIEAAKIQFAQQAVSAADVQIRGASTTDADGNPVGPGEPDAFVQPIKDAHDKAVKAAESAAEKTVSGLHQGES